jgi:hypothetical protein
MVSEHALGQVRISADTEAHIKADIDVIDRDGAVRFRLTGWEDRPFRVPRAFYKARFKPEDVNLSEPWPEAVSGLNGSGTMLCYRMQDYSNDVLHAHGKIWLRVMAYLTLNRSERKIWRTRWHHEQNCSDWLLARVALKDALRSFFKSKYGIKLLMPDIELKAEKNGQIYISGFWKRQIDRLPIVSLSHAPGIGMAMLSEKGRACGIQVLRKELPGEFNRQRFLSDQDLDLLQSMGLLQSPELSPNKEWLLRIQSAKEAVKKMFSAILIDGKTDLTVSYLNPQTGKIDLSIADSFIQQHPQLPNESLRVCTFSEENYVVASVLIKEGDENGKS